MFMQQIRFTTLILYDNFCFLHIILLTVITAVMRLQQVHLAVYLLILTSQRGPLASQKKKNIRNAVIAFFYVVVS